jgi:uncharacterized membrane protein YkvA (DUF1232 family)
VDEISRLRQTEKYRIVNSSFRRTVTNPGAARLLLKTKRSELMLRKPDEEYVREGAEKITDKDIENVADHAEDIRKQFSARGPLKRFIEDGRMLTALIKDWRTGNYRRAMRWTIAAAAFALIYVINPFDIVPDVLPFVGAVDDATVIAACLMLTEFDLHKYREWKISQAGRAALEDVTHT